MNSHSIDISALTDLAKNAAIAAGKQILEVYHSEEIGLELKADSSPLTLADKAAHEKIVKALLDSGLPILSEEGAEIPFEQRRDWAYFWMVDPLDGTKEFVNRNGEFTVNIALIHQGQPIMGVVYAPVLDWLYWGIIDSGSWKQIGKGKPEKLATVINPSVKTIAASRSHMNSETREFIAQFPNAEVHTMGSSLKFMLVAENKAQMYPRFGPTMEWDTAAAHAVVSAMGGKVLNMGEKIPLTYNKKNLLNPDFLVLAWGG